MFGIKKININYFHLLLSILILSVFFPIYSLAATLHTESVSNSYQVGDVFSVKVFVKSSGEVMNAVSTNLNFTKELLEVVSVSKGSSIIDFWAEQPVWNNVNGSISFEGLVLNGYNGETGNLATIMFKAKNTGIAKVDFSTSDILVNDGLGTSIMSGKTGSTFLISEEEIGLEQDIEDSKKFQEPLKIVSTTHPIGDRWYSNNSPSFSWNVPDGVTDIDYVYGKSEVAKFDDNTSKGFIDSTQLNDLEDGEYYIHVIYKTQSDWSEVSTFKFKIDTTSPKNLFIEEINKSLYIASTDSKSGISHYLIKLNGNLIDKWQGEEGYSLDKYKKGTYKIEVVSVDNAGNELSDNIIVNISGNNLVNSLVYVGLLIILLLIIIIIILLRSQNMSRDYIDLISEEKIKKNKSLLKSQEDKIKKRLLKFEKLNKTVRKLEVKIKKEINEMSEEIGEIKDK